MYKLQAFTKNMPIFCTVEQNQKLHNTIDLMDSRHQSGSTIDLLPVKCFWGSRESRKVCCSSNLLIDLSETPVIIDVCWTGFIGRKPVASK